MSSGKVAVTALASLVIGGAAGAILGILFAPEKGSTTRRRLSLQGGYYSDDLHDKIDHLKQSIDSKFESLKGSSEEAIDKGKEKFNEAKDKAKEGLNGVKNEVNSIKSDIA
jgi:gas vesicle protein